jgi:hypothetical protein
MEKDNPGNTNGEERRSGKDRRKAERRDPARAAQTGVLSTRQGDRRREGRRAEDRAKDQDQEPQK